MTDYYEISYAYPSSTDAGAVGRSKTGAYIVKHDEKVDRNGFTFFSKNEDFATYAEADEYAKTLTWHEPSRWSIDHPLNLRSAS